MQITKKEIGKIFEKLQLDVRSTKHNARIIHPGVLPNTKEILTILFHFSSPESFAAMNFVEADFS